MKLSQAQFALSLQNHRISFSSRATSDTYCIYEPDQGCSSEGWTLVKRFTWPDNPDVGKSTVLSVQELRSTPTHSSKLKTYEYFNSFLYVYNITMFDAEKDGVFINNIISIKKNYSNYENRMNQSQRYQYLLLLG